MSWPLCTSTSPIPYVSRWTCRSGPLTYAWVVVAVPVLAVVGAFYLPLVRRLPPGTALGVVLVGTLHLTGTVLIEMVGGELDSLGDARSVAYVIESTVEEAFEMSALLLSLGTLDRYSQDLGQDMACRAADRGRQGVDR